MTTLTTRERFGRIVATVPNWKEPVVFSMEYRTGIFTSRNGTERREAERQQPRMTVSYKALLTESLLQRWMADMAEGQHVPLYVHAAFRKRRLAGAVAPGATAISINEAAFWIDTDAYLIIESSGFQEIAQVASAAGTTVNLVDPLAFGYDADDSVFLAYSARVEDSQDFRAYTSTVWQDSIDFAVEPGSPFLYDTTITPDTFEGVEIVKRKMNWRTTPRVRFMDENREVVDPNHGTIEVTSPTGRMFMEIRGMYLAATRDDVEDLLALFARQKGKRGSFWMPTWQRDLRATGTQPAANQVRVPGVDAFYAFDGNDVYNVVAALWPDGSIQLNRVASISLDGANSLFTFNDNWSNTISDTSLLSWCPLWRFGTDKLEIALETPSIADVTLNFRTIPNQEVV